MGTCGERERKEKKKFRNIFETLPSKINNNQISKSYNIVLINEINESNKKNNKSNNNNKNIKSTKLLNNVNDSFQKKDKKTKENKYNKKEKKPSKIETVSEIKEMNNNYSNLNDNNIYYLVCPKCKNHTPIIEEIKYDNKKNDYMIKYKCQCISNSDNTFLYNLLSIDKPFDFDVKLDNIKSKYFCKDCKKSFISMSKKEHNGHEINKKNNYGFDVNINYIKKIINDKKSEFKGGKIIYNYYQSYINEKKNDEKIVNDRDNEEISSISDSFNISNRETLVKKSFRKKLLKGDNIDSMNEIKMAEKIEEPKKEFIKNEKINQYFSVKKLQHSDRVISLIELKSGWLASGTDDGKIYIWSPHSDSPYKIIQEIGKVLCLLEFEKNKILSGTSQANICLRDLNTHNSDDYICNFLGHQLFVQCLVKYNNQIFSSGSNDGTIRIWNYVTRKEIKALNAHEGGVLCLIKLKNDSLCSGGADLSIKIWNWEQSQCIQTINNAHNNSIKCLCEMNESIISGGDDDKIRIWGKNGCCNQIFDEHIEPVRTLCLIDNNYFASGSFDNKIKIWDFKNNKCIQTISGHSSNVIEIIKLKNNSLASCSTDKTIIIWKKNNFM